MATGMPSDLGETRAGCDDRLVTLPAIKALLFGLPVERSPRWAEHVAGHLGLPPGSHLGTHGSQRSASRHGQWIEPVAESQVASMRPISVIGAGCVMFVAGGRQGDLSMCPSMWGCQVSSARRCSSTATSTTGL